ncbi:MAG: hypothetical protein V1860_04135 [bacterium]
MKNKFLKLLAMMMIFSVPLSFCAANGSAVNSMDVSIDNVPIKNTELEGKISFLPVIRDKDVNIKIGLGACWDDGPYEVRIDDKINNTLTIASGNAPAREDCADWFNSPTAVPAKYTMGHSKTFKGQPVFITYNDPEKPNAQQMEIRVYEDLARDRSSSDLNNSYKGYVMLKAEDKGQLYYISPVSKKAYYIVMPKHTMEIMQGTGIGIKNSDLEKIPLGGQCPATQPNCDNPQKYDKNFVNKYKGYIFLQVEENGEAWYVYPKDGKKYFLGAPEEAYNIFADKAVGISNSDFKKLELAY